VVGCHPRVTLRVLGARQAPEMVRVPLEELVLQIHLLRLGPAGGFLARVLEPPPAKSVAGALAALAAIGALTPDERLTPLGARPSCNIAR
jgi:HrpA-like RNA helicase